jgi:CHAD domain-containing protein
MFRMVELAREVETKFDVPHGFVVPDLRKYADRVDVDTVNLRNTYYDTAERDLFRYRLTLRQREGDADTGWHLKVPGDGFRTEVRAPLGDQLPVEFAELLAPFLSGRPIRPAVRLDTTRTRHRLQDADQQLLAEVAADDVRAVPLSNAARTPHWQEVEIELGPAGSEDDLAHLSRVLQKAGATVSPSRSKLARALDGVSAAAARHRPRTAGEVLTQYIEAQADAIIGGHFAIHQDAPGSIHKTRVGTRRLRSTLRTFQNYVDGAQARAFDGELKWYAAVLGEVRDRDVQRERMTAAVAALPEHLVVGDVAALIDAQLSAEQVARRGELLHTMTGDRYAALLAEVVRWRDNPPFTPAAAEPAKTLQAAVAKIEHKLSKRMNKATKKSGSDEDMHRARKSGKRTRYAAEAASVVNSGSAQLVTVAEEVQDLLGEFQDSVVSVELLRRLAEEAHRRGENTFSYGALAAQQRDVARTAKRRARKNVPKPIRVS